MATLFAKSGDIDLMAEQGAGASFDYGLDWSAFLDSTGGDTIATSEWVTQNPRLTVGADGVVGNVATVFLSGDTPGKWYTIENTITTVASRRETRTCYLFVRDATIASASALFDDRMGAIASVRRDFLPALMSGYGKLNFTDQYIWARLQAAEAHIAHMLRVPLKPTRFFPLKPTQAEIDTLDGMPWDIDPAYDLDPHDVQFGGTRFIKLRQVPVIDVVQVNMVYPGQLQPVFAMPNEWLRLDAKYGHLQIIPIGSQFGYGVPSAGIALTVLAGGALVPHVFHVHYTAGLQNAAQAYPDLMDIAGRLAALSALKARAMPQSGSISADGLSQSYSAPDFGALQDQIDDELEHIRITIVGPRYTVL